MLTGGKLELSSRLEVTFTEVKRMTRMMYTAITRRGSGGLRFLDVGMVTHISAPSSPT